MGDESNVFLHVLVCTNSPVSAETGETVHTSTSRKTLSGGRETPALASY